MTRRRAGGGGDERRGEKARSRQKKCVCVCAWVGGGDKTVDAVAQTKILSSLAATPCDDARTQRRDQRRS